MKNKTLFAAISLLLVATPGLTGCSSNVIEVSSQELSVNVKTATAYEGFLNNGPIFTGTVQANEEVTVVPKLSGRIASIPVEVGMTVKKGDLLFSLEDQDLKNQSLQSEAALGVAKSGIEAAKSSYKNGVIAAENGLNQAASTVSQLKNSLEEINASEKKIAKNLADAQANLNRTKELFAAGAVSKSQLEQAETAFVTAESAMKSVEVSRKTTQDKLATAQVAYNNAKTQLQIAKENPQVTVSEEQLKQAEAAAQIVNHNLGEASIVSPIAGTISSVNSAVGEIVGPQTATVVVSDISNVRALVYVPAEKINTISVGDAVQVKIAAADTSSIGKVSNVSPVSVNGKGYPVEITVGNSELKLKPGMVSEVMFIDDQQSKGTIIPAKALVEKDGKIFVYVVEDGHAKLTEVEVGQTTDSQVSVKSGLNANDKVVTTKVEVLEDGMNIIED
ncbi:efflux RND transporter periplasmic adaptor subunit [Schinkia azotoformans]|uniref:efflux RND transporter periplasmic adaptor subunit n=1 Tax=Schinkia azotoformans TaxID=1454 RepID=UPI002DB74BC5|nr:efflux RND transporter periplasmic adaptor subunit [Schinkia azotoformans]MEC1741788.1 efflux RND transporter periplasmic adaptor subunit [Schinkia azotoformans]MEC1746049.1 efflux RND transporter periplasmic adaptor subunit [Schinkia azotoformans]MEC1757621.1 efflux RND transporter periplasmic adaptor subunit [Schinkia azotoformans]MEC1766988.1 efflux RND transporter periplasmic adaptor subunit [Schinkia azotoformans]MEC1787403.1 efflux RND transporter periplasmic adaptor subunit [Schinkia